MDQCSLKYEICEIGGGWKILVSERGGRIFGPFKDEGDESVVWVNDIFESPEKLKCFIVKEGNWNLGGDRVWITPEFPFFTRERQLFHETYTVQAGIDPAGYVLWVDPFSLRLCSVLSGELFETEGLHKSVRMDKRIRPVENPLSQLKCIDEYMKGVEYCGFEQEIFLEDLTPEVPMEMEMWNLTQINPGGKILVPTKGELEYVDYYVPIDASVLEQKRDCAIVNINSSLDRKVNFKAAQITGRSGYLNQYKDSLWYLFVKNYFNDPSSPYVSEPWDKPGQRGTSLSIYIDGGNQGGFAEFENMGRTFGGRTGRACSQDAVGYWFYFGQRKQLMNIIKLLLGVEV